MSREILRILLICFFMAGCTTFNPATGRNEFIMIPTSDEVQMGQALHAEILKKDQLSTDQKMLERVERIGRSLAAVSDRKDYEYHFFVIEKDELNAFTTTGGNIYFYTGLLKQLNSDDEISAVLAHEIGHCAARHMVKKLQAALGYNIVGSLIFSQIEGQRAQQVASISVNQLTNIIFSAYSRRDESEADRLGVKYMHLAHYDLQGMIKTLEILQKEEEKSKEIPSISRTHPYVKDRIKVVEKEIEMVKAKDKISTEGTVLK